MAVHAQTRIGTFRPSPIRRSQLMCSTGLAAKPKRMPPKYFYDATGSRLFEEITRLPEYYPTRSETRDPQRSCAPTWASSFQQGAALVEFGSGSTHKVRILLAACAAIAAYVPVDISARDAAAARPRS